jgi:hypothetical protein
MNIISNYIRYEYQHFRKWDAPFGARLRASAVIGFLVMIVLTTHLDAWIWKIRGEQLEITSGQRWASILLPWLVVSSFVFFFNKIFFSDDELPTYSVNKGRITRALLLVMGIWGLIRLQILSSPW